MTDRFSDETLTAYLDGELSAEEITAVVSALETDLALRARLATLDIPLETIKASFGAVLESAPAMPELPEPKAQPRGMMAAGIAAALVLAFGLGVLSPFGRSEGETLDWKMAVADYQVLYVPETLTGNAPDTDSGAARLAELSGDLGRDLSSALQVDGLAFRRAQMLGFDGAPLVQIAYLASGDVPVAICVTTVDAGDQPVARTELQGLAAAHWVDDGFGFIVIGGEDAAFVERIARELAEQV